MKTGLIIASLVLLIAVIDDVAYESEYEKVKKRCDVLQEEFWSMSYDLNDLAQTKNYDEYLSKYDSVRLKGEESIGCLYEQRRLVWSGTFSHLVPFKFVFSQIKEVFV